MGLIGLLIGAVIIILLFIYSTFSNSPRFSPKDAQNMQQGAQDAVNSEEQKSKLEQNQIKNLDLR